MDDERTVILISFYDADQPDDSDPIMSVYSTAYPDFNVGDILYLEQQVYNTKKWLVAEVKHEKYFVVEVTKVFEKHYGEAINTVFSVEVVVRKYHRADVVEKLLQIRL